MQKLHIAALVVASMAAPLAANDTVAETAAGGLVFRHSPDIDMVSEELEISAERVRVRYVFRNRAPRDISVTVAFPMPDRDLSKEAFSDVAFPSHFRTLVDGVPVEATRERKAMLRETDHSATLADLGVPLVGPDTGTPIGAVLDALPPAAQHRLTRLGLAGVEEWDSGRGMERHLVPLWTVRETWHWQQTFPAGRGLRVEHSYVPGTGGSVGTPLARAHFRASAEGRQMIADYCIDADFLAGLDRMSKAAGGDYPILPEQRIGYILKTGANWRSPIGAFRLVVDKGAPQNIVSFCGEGVRRIAPTQFEMRRTGWRPDRDLKVLIVQPPPR